MLDFNADQTENETKPDPWEKLSAETDLWYERFHIYLLLGPSRSMPQLVKNIGASPNSVASYYSMAKQFQWKERAQAWDKIQSDREREIVSELRIENKKKRIAILEKLIDKFDHAIDYDLDADVITWQNVAGLTRALMSELRAEYGDTEENSDQNKDFTFTLQIARPHQITNGKDLNDEDFDFDDNIIDIG
jgi:hypothetical protein